MPPAAINLEPVREQITAWYEDGKKAPEVIQKLQDEYDITVKRSRLFQFYQRWGLKKLEVARDSEQLRTRLRELFFQEVLPDKIILKRLQEEGFTINKTRLIAIRREEELYRRQTPEQTRVAIEKASASIKEQNRQSSALKSYGRGLLHIHMRQNGHVISRDATYNTYREIMGENITERFKRAPFRRRTFNLRGVDEIWSIDGHDKLKPWGFEIYGGIDGYARYVTWFYCGVSNATAWNIALQYLSLLKRRKTMPRKMRSDHGGETSIICALHFFLSSRRKKERPVPINAEPHDPLQGGTSGVKTEQQEQELVPIEFKDCWIFGRSIHNTRIEAWWLTLYKGAVEKWRVFFQWLTDHSHFNSGSIADRAAILFIYMNPIRHDLAQYVTIWNSHPIRSQPSRPHVISGKPNVLYYDTSAPRFTEPVPEDLLEFCAEKLDLERTDLDAFLPVETMAICSRIIEDKIGCLPEIPRNPDYPFLHEYLILKEELTRYSIEKREPMVSLIEPITEGRDRLEQILTEYDLTLKEEGSFYHEQFD